MADTVYSRLLARALQIEGSAQSLAEILRVPEATMLRWSSGKAFMPVQAFQRVIAYIEDAERRGTTTDSTSYRSDAQPEPLQFPIGPLFARCAQCDGVEFRRTAPDAPLRMSSALACCDCGTEAIHAELLAKLAADVVGKKRTEAAARAQRQAAMAARRTAAPPAKRTDDAET